MSPSPRYSWTSIHAVAARQRKSTWDRGSYNTLGARYRTSHAGSKHRPEQGPAAPSSLLPPCTNPSREVTSKAVSVPVSCCGILPSLPFVLRARHLQPVHLPLVTREHI